jgi:hypothetical protein
MIRIIITLWLTGAPTTYVGDFTYTHMERCRAAALDIVKRIDVLPGNGISVKCRHDKET